MTFFVASSYLARYDWWKEQKTAQLGPVDASVVTVGFCDQVRMSEGQSRMHAAQGSNLRGMRESEG